MNLVIFFGSGFNWKHEAYFLQGYDHLISIDCSDKYINILPPDDAKSSQIWRQCVSRWHQHVDTSINSLKEKLSQINTVERLLIINSVHFKGDQSIEEFASNHTTGQ
ncbi:hypothetical protein [Facilibium subflavum]|uniref:hypothetical protein n=1 Tax=Facilibium subflavum TaxID=2219058 RepID=UPI000E659B87|nr:hypothetical protein [Facilibium subflavum]